MSYSNINMRPQAGAPQFPNYTSFQSVTQPIFPQPSGNVYFVNNNLEVANIPIGAGMSAVLCLPENLLYIKTMQNNMPMLLGYKLSPLESSTSSSNTEGAPDQPSNDVEQTNWEEKIKPIIEQYENKIKALEDSIQGLEEKVGGLLKCQF